jgi:hypothetical protein
MILIVTCLLLPVVILVNLVLSTLLALTSILWMTLVITFYHAFNLLIYRTFYHHRGMVLPLFRILFFTILNLGKIVLCALAVVALPIGAIFKMGWQLVYYYGGALWEGVVVCVVRRFGRTPAEDSFAARCVAGPGVSKNYFNSISQEDTILAYTSHLEKM